MATGRLPDPNTAPLTAKGDLYTYSTVPARLAVGSNGDTLVADSSASQGLSYQANWAAGKNKIINGAFDIWQRGTSVNLTNSTTSFLADRFSCLVNFSAGTASISRQTFTPGAAPVAGYEGQFFHRLNTGTTATYLEFNQRIEDVRTLAGQTITVSFWAKSSANVTLINLMRQNFGSGGSANVDKSTTFNITTSWVRYSWTITLDSVSGKTIGANSFLLFALYRDTGALGGLNIDIWGVQVEAGSVATAFQTATGTLAGELAACRRYLPCLDGNNSDQIMGYAYASNAVVYGVQFDVPARVAPTGITPSGTINGFGLNTQYAITPTYNTSSVNGCSILGTSGVTITAGQGSRLYMASGSKILFTGCEL